jgi:hypothetical protein
MTSKTGSTILSALMFAGASLMLSPAAHAAAQPRRALPPPPHPRRHRARHGPARLQRPGRQGRPGRRQHPHHRARAPGAGRGRRRDAGIPAPLLRRPDAAARRPRRPRNAAAAPGRTGAARRRLRLHRFGRWLRDDQCARGRRRGRGHRHPDRPPRIQGQGAGRGRPQRRRPAEGGRAQPAVAAHRRFEQDPRGRMGDRDRLARSTSKTRSPPASSRPRRAIPANTCR